MKEGTGLLILNTFFYFAGLGDNAPSLEPKDSPFALAMKIADLLRTAHLGLTLRLVAYSILMALRCHVPRVVQESGGFVEESGECGRNCQSI